MKFTINQTSPLWPVQYPWIGQSTENPNMVVLFVKKGCGVVLRPSATGTPFNKTGAYVEDFCEAYFHRFPGDITLAND